MHDSRAVFLVAPDKVQCVRTVWEKVEDKDLEFAKTQLFKTTDKTLAVGDLVVAEIQSRHGMAVFKVVALAEEVDLRSETPLHWIVSKIDQAAHLVNTGNERKLTDAIRKGERKRIADQLAKDVLEGIDDDVKSITFG